MSCPDSQYAQPESRQADDTPTLSQLERIKDGVLDPSCIHKDDRQLLVAVLMADGYSTAEMAKIFKVGDRTIERDKKDIRENNALTPDPKLAGEMAGRMKDEAELSIQQIRRAIRGRNVPVSVKVEGHHRCVQIFSEAVQNLQRLGYLPTAAHRFDGTVTHHLDQLPSLEDIRTEVKRLEVISQTSLPNSEASQLKLQKLQQDLERVDLAAQVHVVASGLSTMEDSNEHT